MAFLSEVKSAFSSRVGSAQDGFVSSGESPPAHPVFSVVAAALTLSAITRVAFPRIPLRFLPTAQGVYQGVAKSFQVFFRNFADRDILSRRAAMGFLTGAVNFAVHQSQTFSEKDVLPTEEGIKQSLLVGSLSFVGTMFLPKNGFIKDLGLTSLYAASDLLGPISRRYLINGEKGVTWGHEVGSVGILATTAGVSWLYYHRYLKWGWRQSTVLVALNIVANLWLTKKAQEHGGNPRLSWGRAAANSIGGLASELVPLHLRSSLGTVQGFSGIVTGGVILAIRNLMVAGPAMTNFYAQLGNTNWENAQIANGARQMTAMLPVRMWQVAVPANGVGQFLATVAGDMGWGTVSWVWFDERWRSLAGKGQWRLELKERLNGIAYALENGEEITKLCQELEGYIYESMSSFDPIRGRRVLEEVDFHHRSPTFLPGGRNFISLEDYVEHLTSRERHALLACQKCWDPNSDLYRLTRKAIERAQGFLLSQE